MSVNLFKKIRAACLLFYCGFRYNKSVFNSCKINGYCKFNGNENFGNNINFNGCKVYGNGNITFGNNFHSAKGLTILTSFHNYEGTKVPYDHTVITKDIVIEENVWIGMNVTLLGGVTLGEGCIIQAGSVVVKSVDALSIVGGHPAKVFSKRNEKHYYRLKQLNQVL